MDTPLYAPVAGEPAGPVGPAGAPPAGWARSLVLAAAGGQRHRPRRAAAAAAAALLATGFLAVAARAPHPGAALGAARWANKGLESKGQLPACQGVLDGIDYWTRMTLNPVNGIASAEACRAKCQDHPGCGAWTWGRDPGMYGVTHVCFLKRLQPGEKPMEIPKAGVVSGLPCRAPGASAGKAKAPCDFEDGTDYVTGSNLLSQSHVMSAEVCRAVCRSVPGCDAWTWGKMQGIPTLSNICWLKSLKQNFGWRKIAKADVISGLACTLDASTRTSTATSTSTGTTTTSSVTTRTGTTVTSTSTATTRTRSTTTITSLTSTTSSTRTSTTATTTTTTVTATTTLATTVTSSRTSTTSSATLVVPTATPAASTRTRPGQSDKELGDAVDGNVSGTAESAQTTPASTLSTTSTNSITTATGTSTSSATATSPATTTGTPSTNSSTTTKATVTASSTTLSITATATSTSATATDTTLSTTVTATTTTRRDASSLFCFALSLPTGYEPELLAMQYRRNTSLFACDEYAVYSNQTFAADPGFGITLLGINLECQRGGEFRTQLNVKLFGAVWARIISDGHFKRHAWTVKVDADTVFIPSRLRRILNGHDDVDLREKTGMYFNNCRFGMHGPIEVFSRNAVQALGAGWHHCRNYFHMACSGPCWWSEDLFIDQCLSQVLYVKRETERDLLSETRCSPPKDWRSCKDSSKVAFHPFKDGRQYKECLDNAEGHNSRGALVFK